MITPCAGCASPACLVHDRCMFPKERPTCQPMESAPRNAWILAFTDSLTEPHAVISDEEEGWWEDETGDYYVEASFNDGRGLTVWAPLPEGYTVENWMGTNRGDEPIYRPPPNAEA